MDRNEFESIAPGIREHIVRMTSRLAPEHTGTGLPDDVAQDTLLRLWTLRERLDSYRSVEALASVIARNRTIDLLRSDKTSIHKSINGYDSPDSCPNPLEAIEQAESHRELMDIISSIPSAQQALIRMRHIEELEINEIAAITGSTEGAIRVALSRARTQIKKIFIQRNS